jgi:DNA repair protein SbcD/Mre11
MLHTSDIHIGADAAAISALDSVVRLAIESDVDVVLIAGDLFDSDVIPGETVAYVVDKLRQLDRPTVVIAGNHDPLAGRSIYSRVSLQEAGGHIMFAAGQLGETFVLPQLSLAVWAKSITVHNRENNPLSGYRRYGNDYWNVAVVHGHFEKRGENSGRSSPISEDEIASMSCDYVAMGHVHRFFDVSQPGVRACYSGTPCRNDWFEPTVNLVTLSCPAGVTVERIQV